ncbi:MAG: DUF6498-containing protein [Candidatus Micrarchaeota archaeon]
MDLQKLEISSGVLIAANLLTIILAIVLQYDFGVIVWAYLIESIIIGIFIIPKMILTGIRSQEAGTIITSLFLSGFFCIHYGGFHAAYLFFLTIIPIFDIGNFDELILMSGILFTSHLFSFIHNINKENNLNSHFFSPYIRIIPMHITIILSGFIITIFPNLEAMQKTAIVAIFMLLKTVADLDTHQKKHNINDSLTN